MTSGRGSDLLTSPRPSLPGAKAPEEVGVEMIASAIDCRGIWTRAEHVKVAPETWTLDDFCDAEPEG